MNTEAAPPMVGYVFLGMLVLVVYSILSGDSASDEKAKREAAMTPEQRRQSVIADGEDLVSGLRWQVTNCIQKALGNGDLPSQSCGQVGRKYDYYKAALDSCKSGGVC
ncbi:MAG: hypothetical protein CTY31_12370 [Hyphomicrobium sp.]|nr:MAG: hypothetical protein CTY39_11980 [Hyphomicrobium sp.]PPC98807.1 MAG: hypothetical protein CTY31_12370 [Hyphomicrobium sp.]